MSAMSAASGPASGPKTDANPSWASPSRQFVPLHLQPGAARSSFARPDTYNLHRQKSLPQATPPAQRSGFATKPKSKARRSGAMLEMEDELPPTRSIRVLTGPVDEPDLAASPTVAAQFAAQAAAQAAQASTSTGSGPSTAFASAHGTPVIVFGFPPGSTQSVLQFFGAFGEITENVAGNDAHAAAIECGRNWLRITYRDRDAAQRALAQNGHVMPGQYVIGCVLGEPGEYASTMQQSSTNSMLLDDSDVSLLQDQSMASVLDVTEDEHAAPTASVATSNSSVSPPASASSDMPVLSDKIVPREMNTHLFRESTPAKPAVKISEINSTKLPDAPAPTGLVGRLTSAISHALFDWDV